MALPIMSNEELEKIAASAKPYRKEELAGIGFDAPETEEEHQRSRATLARLALGEKL